MTLDQLVGLEHAAACADRQRARVEGELQGALRGLAARPKMLLLHEHVIVDVANRQRTVSADPSDDLANILLRYRSMPADRLRPMALHLAQEKSNVPGRHIG